MERFNSVDEQLRTQSRRVHPLDGDTLLNNQDMCQLFKISKRTLAG